MPSHELLPNPQNIYRPSVIMIGDSPDYPNAEAIGVSFLGGIAFFNPENNELTREERDCAAHLVMGATNATIGAVLALPDNKVQQRTSHVLKMSDVQQRSGLLGYYLDPDVGIMTMIKPAGLHHFDAFTDDNTALTARIAQGMPNKLIAKEEGVKPATVLSRADAIKKKLGYTTVDLVAAGAVLSGFTDTGAIFDYKAAKNTVIHYVKQAQERDYSRFAVRYVR